MSLKESNQNSIGSKKQVTKPVVDRLDTQSKQEDLSAHAIQLARTDPGNLKPAQLLQLQRSIGNQAFVRLLGQASQNNRRPASATQFVTRKINLGANGSTLQRDEVAGGAVKTRPWKIPFKGGRATTYAKAMDGLAHIDSFIFFNASREMPKVWRTQLDSIQDAAERLYKEMKGKSGPLELADTGTLEVLGSMAEGIWDSAVNDTRKQAEAALKKIKGGSGFDRNIEELQEKLHFAFIEGADDKVIKSIQDTLSAFQKYKAKVDEVVSWASTAASILKSAKLLDFFNKTDDISRTFGQVATKAEQIATAARLVSRVAKGTGASGDFAALDNFETALDAIDFGMGFVEGVPLFSKLWSSYYGPVTRQCLRLLRKIAKLVDKSRRDETLFEWMTNRKKSRMGDGSPKIPRGYASYFPGGQAVLSYMWAKCNSGSAYATGSVRSFFVTKADKLNAGVSKGGVKLKTESTKELTSPSTWFADDRAVNLDTFVGAHRSMIWAMLYGSIPQNV